MSSFTHLHVHSHYSLLDGLPKVEELVSFAKDQGMTAVALTDHGVLYGAIEFYQQCTKAGIKPIIGVEVYVAPHGHTEKRAKIDDQHYHLTLLAENDIGYRNLIKLVSLSHIDGYYYRPRVDHALLEKYHDGLICLSGCLHGEVPTAILSGNTNEAEKLIRWHQDTFGKDNYFLELQDHVNLPNQALVNAALIAFGKKLDVPLVATNDSHYLRPEDADVQDILLCINQKKQQSDSDRLSMRETNLSFRSADDMVSAFANTPEAITNTMRIAERCNVTIELGTVQLPHYDVPAGETGTSFLRKLAEAGIPRRYGTMTPAVKERLEYELSVIEKTGFGSYFLIVQDFVNWAKGQGIVVGPGRGSAAGSIIAYLLNITDIDPLRYDLLFERFLNPERIAMPDIDIDFADTRRDEVLRYVESRYGTDHVAQIITFGTMAARAGIRDVGRVLGFPYSYCDRVAKLIPMFTSLQTAIDSVPELKEIYDNDPDAKRLLDSAMKLEGVARHASRHACGVVITKDPLETRVPVQYASADDHSIISQYSLHPIEDLGLLKMDFLGLSNLTILEQCLRLIKETRGIDLKLDDIPYDDKKTFQLFQRADTTGVFQLESSGMKRYLRELKPTSLEDIIAMVALYRPGPMDLIPQYIARKHGREPIRYTHPLMEKVLKNTYGIIVYQEQVMDMATELAGMTKGQGYLLIKAVGKKIKKLLDEQKDKFIQGCLQNNIPKKVADETWEQIEPFARYGFNKAHSACYATIAYHTAYCKANFPAEFMAALLTSDQHNTDRIAIEVEDSRRMGLEILPPDINESFATFAVPKSDDGLPGRRIRFGLQAVKNVGEHLVEEIITERTANGAFLSFEDFLQRVRHKDLNKKSLESLAKVGCFDRWLERQAIVTNVNELLKFAKQAETEATQGQMNIFGSLPTRFAPSLRLQPVPAATNQQRAQWEKDLMGLYISDHPLNDHRHSLARVTTPINQLAQTKSTVKIGGIISMVKKIKTKRNEQMVFVRLEDLSGAIEVVVFPSLYQSSALLWEEQRLVIVEGKSNARDGEWKMLADKVWDLAQIVSKLPPDPTIRIRVALDTVTPQDVEELHTFLRQEPGDRPVELVIRKGMTEKPMPTEHRILWNADIRQRLEARFGQCIIE